MRRKDYLHEEAKGVVFTPDQIPNNALNKNRILQFIQDTIVKTKNLIASISSITENQGGGSTLASDLKADEYFKQIEELKITLAQLADQEKHDELKEKVSEIPHLNFKDFEKIFKVSDYSRTVFLDRLIAPFYTEKIKALRLSLQKIDSTLSACSLYIKALD